MSILVTGGAGFIGSHLCEALLKDTDQSIVCIDSFNDFYDPKIKRNNIAQLLENPRFTLFEGDILDTALLDKLFTKQSIDTIFHLAAYAGVRPSIQNPHLYYKVNVEGTLNILECARKFNTKKIIFASSSSIYGNNKKTPFSEQDNVDHPISPYAATKKAGELLCYNYHHLYGIPVACIRFFTVYGPRQRPEMAIHKFAQMISDGQPIPVFNNGLCNRDYTYIDDIIQGLLKIMDTPFTYDIINLGESGVISTKKLIALIEAELKTKAKINTLPPQPGDVDTTFADISKATEKYGYSPAFPIEKGIREFIKWFTAKI